MLHVCVLVLANRRNQTVKLGVGSVVSHQGTCGLHLGRTLPRLLNQLHCIGERLRQKPFLAIVDQSPGDVHGSWFALAESTLQMFDQSTMVGELDERHRGSPGVHARIVYEPVDKLLFSASGWRQFLENRCNQGINAVDRPAASPPLPRAKVRHRRPGNA